MTSPELETIATKLVSTGKGIGAFDESPATMGKRFDFYGVDNTFDNRVDYREMLATAPGAGQYLGGEIFHPEMLDARLSDGSTIPEVLSHQKIEVIAKVDQGLIAQPLSTDEKLTKGRDSLMELMEECKEKGATAAKWRAVVRIDHDKDLPTSGNIWANNTDMVIYAEAAQKSGLVPILEPEVLIDGDHSIEDSFYVTRNVLEDLFYRVEEHSLDPRGLLLKTSMVIQGKESLENLLHTEMTKKIGELTVRCLRETVPAELPGVVFLSGGQSAVEATRNLNEINIAKPPSVSAAYSFSFGRALQEDALRFWALGDRERAQAACAHRAKMNSLASMGVWSPDIEKEFET